MSIGVVAHGVVQSTNSNGFTTGGLNFAGADCIVVGIVENPGTTGTVITDSRGNTWPAPTFFSQGTHFGWTYAKNASTGAAQTLTVGGTGSFVSIVYWALSGTLQSADPFDQSNANFVTAGTSLQPGTLTPAVNNSIVLNFAGFGGAGTRTINGGFTNLDQAGLVGGTAYGIAGASLIQTTATATNPTWSWTGNENGDAIQLIFKPALGGLLRHPGMTGGMSDMSGGMRGYRRPWRNRQY